MGGFGSGRYEYATTPTVEECRHLGADNFTDAVEHPGRESMVYWGGQEDHDASIRVVLLGTDHVDALAAGETPQVRPDGDPDNATEATVDLPPGVRTTADHVDDDRAVALLLAYRVTDHRADETRRVRYIVPLEYTECHFGGSRPWFRCPGAVDGRRCGERVGKLYNPPREDLYLCRDCYDLGYRSSRSSGDDVTRAIQRYRKAFAKADAENRHPHPNNAPYFPERPTGMHHDTFEDLTDDVRGARREFHDAMEQEMLEMRQRYADLAGVDLPSTG